MADPKSTAKNPDATSPAVPAPEDDRLPEAGEDMNSTMMAIDVSKLNLDATKTGLKIQPGELFPPPGLPKKSFFEKLKDKLLGREEGAEARPRKFLPQALRAWQGSWLCDPNHSILSQAGFYLFRLFILAASAWCQWVFIGELARSYAIAHPARHVFALAFAVQALLMVAVVVIKASPGWILTLPLSVLALIMAYGASFYHTADPLYFTIQGRPVSSVLNAFYFLVLIYGMCASVFTAARHPALRMACGLLYLLAITPILIGFSQGQPLENAFFGPGFLRFVPTTFLQPIFLSFHAVMPALLVLLVGLSLTRSKADIPAEKFARGLARSLAVLVFSLIALNFALMQKNRVTHIFNAVFPKTLYVGGIEVKILNQNLKIETRNFAENEGLDRKSRYRFKIEKSKDKGKYVLKLQDPFGFPVKYLTKDDLRLYSDDVEIKKYGFSEEDDPKLESGRYVLTLPLSVKEPPVKWSSEKQALSPSDKFAFKLTDAAKVKRFVVRRDEDVLLEAVSPQSGDIQLPLQYFQTGPHKLTVSLYDDLDQEIFRDEVNLSVKLQNDFEIISPLPGDIVGGEAGVLLFLKGVKRDTVRAVRYSVNGQGTHEAQGMNYFHSLDLSSYPDGELTLGVKAQLPDREISHEVKVVKKSEVPKLVITQPAMGVFAERDARVAYRLENGGGKITDVGVWVNGMPFSDVAIKEGGFDLPVMRWEDSEIYFVVQATLEDGGKVSDWVQVNRGMSVLDLKFDARSLNFLNVNKIGILLDASVSSWDNWQGKSKWYTMTNLIMAPEVESRLKVFNPTVSVFGNGKPYYFDDCDDAKVVSRGPDYNKTAIKRSLENISPQGVSALVHGLNLLYDAKPEKVFVFSDSADACEANLVSALKPVFSKSPQTVVNVFSLGRVGERDRKQLRELAEKTGGRYFQPDSYDTLLKSWLGELSLNYELLSRDKSVYQSSLEDREFRLGPGTYTLKIPYGNQIKAVELKLDHGTKTTLTVMGKEEGGEKKISVEQVVTQL